MLILSILTLLVPALIGVLFYERFKDCELGWVKRVELFLVFAFLTNMFNYAVMWLRGWETFSWTLGLDSTMISVPVMFQYMVISLVFSVALAYVGSLVRVEKSRSEAGDEADETNETVDTSTVQLNETVSKQDG